MSKSILHVAFCLVPLMAPSAQVPEARPAIDAHGQVVVRVQPTHATLYLLVEAGGPTAAEAMQRVAGTAAVVRDSLSRVGTVGTIEVTQYGVSPSAAAPYGGGAPANAFTARVGLKLTSATDRLAALTTAAFSTGATGLGPPQFRTADSVALVTRAVGEASVQARARAEAMAKALGVRLGRLLSLSAPQSYNPEYPQQFTFPTPNNPEPMGRPFPEVRFTVNVIGRWELLPP